MSPALYNSEVIYRVHNSIPMDPIFSNTNLVHICRDYFSNTDFNIILPSSPNYREWNCSFMFSA